MTPRAGRTAIAGWRDGVLLVRVTAPPIDGAANAAVVALLAKTLKVPKSSIRIVSGDAARTKRVRIAGVTVEDLRARLGP